MLCLLLVTNKPVSIPRLGEDKMLKATEVRENAVWHGIVVHVHAFSILHMTADSYQTINTVLSTTENLLRKRSAV